MPSLNSATYQAGCWELPFCFPNGGTKAQICVLSLAHKFGPAFCMCPISIYLLKIAFATVRSAHSEPVRGSRCLWLRHTECLDAVGQLEGSACPRSTVTCWLPLEGVLNTVSRICIPSICFKSLICSFPRVFLLPSHAAHDSVFWMGEREIDLFGNVLHS